ncbi:MAG TPA: penicillin-binding protein 2 [Candidatus Kapabacteria bacterium]|nr:penicillin-binding protein 2 [Candidatus Kapabacteria bacterium]
MARKKGLTQPLILAMQIRRLCFFAGCIITGFIGLAYRLVDLQVVQHERFVEAARRNTEKTIVRQPKRGDIRDVRGNLLATSKIVHTVCADPEVLGTNYITVAKAVAPLLEMPEDELREMLRPKTRVTTTGQVMPVKYVRLKRKVELETWQAIQETMKRLTFGIDESKLGITARAFYHRIRGRGIFSEPQELRFYPNQSLAAHVLGYVGIHEKTDAEGRKQEETIVGRDGLEYMLNSVLTGVRGWRQIEIDSKRREVVLYREQDVAPRPGLNAVLTLDEGVQHIVEDELKTAFAKHNPVSISCVVVRPKTGEIVAMATLPTFNPNALDDSKAYQRRNRVISDQAEPGSTFKIVVVSAGINEKEVDLNTLIDCENGTFFYGGRKLSDAHEEGVITVERVVSKSSNIGSAKIAIQLGKQRLYDYVKSFGFGDKTGILLPGEIDGTVHPVSKWSGLSITRIPMGHEVDCTPLQMVMAMSAIANGGTLMKPLLVESLVDENGKVVAKFEPQAVRDVVSAETSRKMVTALKTTVSTNGTGLKAKLPFHTVAGKTGTAQKLVNGQYTRSLHYSSFIGFFPADDPELCISVVVDAPDRKKGGYYGSETAAPIFQKIAERAANYLAIPADQIPEQTLAQTSNGRAL